MDEQLISKKDLLETTDISYGQLYRWKRKDLIPEDWFIRKSTYTGQETFFPKEKILARINKIKELKNDLSLDDLVDVFSPQLQSELDKAQLLKCNIVTDNTLTIFTEEVGDKVSFSFQEALHLYMLNQSLADGLISLEEAKLMIRTIQQKNDSDLHSLPLRVILARKMGMPLVILTEKDAKISLDAQTKIIIDVNMELLAEEVKNLLFIGGV